MLFLDEMGRLQTNLCGIQLENPVIAASGTYGYGVEFSTVADLNAMGGLVVKGLSREPIAGNPPASHVGDRSRHDQFDRSAEHRRASLCSGKTTGPAPAFEPRSLPTSSVISLESYAEVIRVLEDAEGIAGMTS